MKATGLEGPEEDSTIDRRQLAAISTVTFLYFLSWQMARPMVPLHAAALGLEPLTIGLMVGSMSLLGIAVSVPAGGLSDALGFRPVLAIGLLGMAAALSGYAWSRHPLGAALALVAFGGFEVLVWITAQAYATRLTRPGTAAAHTATVIGVVSLAASLGDFAGPALGGWVAGTAGFPAAFWLAAAFATLGSLGTLRLANLPPGRRHHRPTPGTDYRRAWRMAQRPRIRLSLAFSTAMITMLATLQSFYPLYLARAGYPPQAAGLMVSVIALVSALFRPLAGRLVDRALGARLLGGVLLAGGLATAAIGLFKHWAALVAVTALAGFAAAFNHPVGISLIAESTRAFERGTGLGLRIAANRLWMMLIPTCLGLLAGVVGVGGALAVQGGLLSAAAVAVRRQAGRALPAAHRPGGEQPPPPASAPPRAGQTRD